MANGYAALYSNTSGTNNTADGTAALTGNTTGTGNTAAGDDALAYNTTGFYNIAMGYQAGYNITTGSSNIDIGNLGLATDTNIIRIGSSQTQTYIAGVINGNGGGLTNLNAGSLGGSQLSTVTGQGGLAVGTNIYLNNYTMYLRNDQNQGLAYSGTTVTNFGTGNVQMDSPV